MSTDNSQLKAGLFILDMLKKASENNLAYVYLRNYEKLPEEIGNDVDLLIYPKDLKKWLGFLKESTNGTDFSIKEIKKYSCYSIFFEDKCSDEHLHIDLFTHIEYHFYQFGYVKNILERREFNGKVYKPNVIDELFLNIMTRLLYHGIIREKHRVQWAKFINQIDVNELKLVFTKHLGFSVSNRVIAPALNGKWEEVEKTKSSLRFKLFLVAVFKRPFVTIQRFFAFVFRVLSRHK